MAAKIFGIGLSRTGTASLHYLMEALGYKSKHFWPELIANPALKIPDDMQVIMDSPVPLLYKKLDKEYPGSKFILTTRNKSAWLGSMKWMFTHGKAMWNWPPLVHEYHEKFYHTKKYDEKILSRFYDEFHADVGEYFKSRKDDLLVLNIDEKIDTAAICKFLSIPVKDVQFTKVNVRKKASLKRRIKYNLHYAIYGTNLK